MLNTMIAFINLLFHFVQVRKIQISITVAVILSLIIIAGVFLANNNEATQSTLDLSSQPPATTSSLSENSLRTSDEPEESISSTSSDEAEGSITITSSDEPEGGITNTSSTENHNSISEGSSNSTPDSSNENNSKNDTSANSESSTPSGGIPPVSVQQVTVSYTALEMQVGDNISLLATVIYSDNTIDNLTIWSSSNPAVATVDSEGNIVALSAGTTTITAQASKNNSAKSASCIVTVINPPSIPTGYSIRLSTDHAIIGEAFRLYITPFEDDVTEIRVYTISPSGLTANFPLSEEGKYLIDTEAGIWTIYASVTNAAGTYIAQRPEDYVKIKITSFEDIFDNMFQGML